MVDILKIIFLFQDLAQICLRIHRILFFGTMFLCGMDPPVLKLHKTETGLSEYISVVEEVVTPKDQVRWIWLKLSLNFTFPLLLYKSIINWINIYCRVRLKISMNTGVKSKKKSKMIIMKQNEFTKIVFRVILKKRVCCIGRKNSSEYIRNVRNICGIIRYISMYRYHFFAYIFYC